MAIGNIGLQEIHLDISTKLRQKTFYANEVDTEGRGLHAFLQDNGIKVDGTGVTMQFRYKSLNDGEAKVYDFTPIGDPINGEFEIHYPSEMVRGHGNKLFPCTIVANDLTSELAFENVFVYVNKAEVNTEGVEASNEYSSLKVALDKVDTWDSTFEAKYTGLETTYATDLTTVKSQLADIVTYNLSEFCDDISKSIAFQTFMGGLSDAPKTLYIPKGKVLRTNQFFFIPSNTLFTGGGEISFEGIVTTNTLFNESLIANKNGTDSNIEFDNVKITYTLSNTGKSIGRFRGVDGFIAHHCTFKIMGDGTQGHNAVLDFFKGNRNVTVEDNKFILDNPDSLSGGAIWMKNQIVTGIDEETMVSDNFVVRNNVFESNCGDEIVATFSAGGNISNVSVYNNTFKRKLSKKNLCLTVIDITTNIVDISNVKYKDNTFIVEAPSLLSNEVIRVGMEGGVIALKGIVVEDNTILGNLENAIAIYEIGPNNEGSIKNNTIVNAGAKGTSFGIKAQSLNMSVSRNNIKNVNTPIVNHPYGARASNIIDNTLVDGSEISSQNLNPDNGYIRYASGVTEQWQTVVLGVNNGATQDIHLSVPFSGFISGSVTPFNITEAYDGKTVSYIQGGYDTVHIVNHSANLLTVKARFLTIT